MPARARARGNHVLRAAAIEHADRQRRRAQRVEPPGGLRVQRDHHLREREDRIAAVVRVGAVRGLALDDDRERVA